MSMSKLQNFLATAVLAVAGAAVLLGAEPVVPNVANALTAGTAAAAVVDEPSACPCLKVEAAAAARDKAKEEAREEAALQAAGVWTER